MDVLLLEHNSRYDGSYLIGIFSNDETGKPLAMKTGDEYVERNWNHLKYSSDTVTLFKIRLNSPKSIGRLIKKW
jgi:hypothetical protein